MIDQLGKGCLPDSPDERDFKANPVLMALPPVDWSIGFQVAEPPNENQGTSSSCVAQAWSYYHWQLRPKDFSRRDIYNKIHLEGGGAYIRDGGLRIVKFGQATRDELPDPQPETEIGMTQPGGTPEQEASDIEADSYVINSHDIDSVAQAIREFKGVVFGLQGTNTGWQDMANPSPPNPNETVWGHALYCIGYHLHDGVKCIICKSSWGNSGNTTTHHIKENYFVSGNTFNPWTLIPKGYMPQFKTQNYKGELRIVLQASTPEEWKALCAVFGKDPIQIDEVV